MKSSISDNDDKAAFRASIINNTVNESMFAEEERLEREAKELEEKELLSERKYEPDRSEKRFECLVKLMRHSELYTQYLTEKMSTQVSMRRFEKTRKLQLMRLCESRYLKKQIDAEPYIKESQATIKNEEEDPESILDHLMLNIDGEIVSMQQPFTLQNVTLRKYQMDGLHWLKVLYENGVNGILADEMGLGKTVQCIALICHLLEMGLFGPFLIIAPLSTLSNWVNEFSRCAPEVPIMLYHGDAEHRSRLRKEIKKVDFVDVYAFPVILTSYEIAMRDRPFLEKFVWKYLVVDEGHRLKNFNCQLVRELKRLTATNRLLLTGTPLQNNLSELWSLMNFLVPEVFGDLATFESWLDPKKIIEGMIWDKIIQQEQEQKIVSTMHNIFRPFLLRRTKADVEISIPPKKEVIVYAPLSELQEEYYKATLDKSIRKVLGIQEMEYWESPTKEANDGKKLHRLRSSVDRKTRTKSDEPLSDKHVKMGNVTMQLRRIVNHPYLVNYPIDPATNEYKVNEELVKSSGKLLVMDAMLSRLHGNGHKILLFTQMTSLMDILEDYLNLRNYSYVRLDGTMKYEDRKAAMNAFQNNMVFIFLLSTRAGGLGLNLTAADTVILYDSDWNPQVDLQAMDRCHRIGQTCPVVVYRLVTAATIDEHMVQRATGKKKLEMLIIQKGKFKEKKQKVAGISIQELQDLLKSSNERGVHIQPNGLVFSDQELDSLLDRSDLLQKTEEGLDKTPKKDKVVNVRGRKRIKLCNRKENINSRNGKENNSSLVNHKVFNVIERDCPATGEKQSNISYWSV